MNKYYKPRQAYLYDEDKQDIVGRFRFQIGGKMSDGTKCWYMIDDNGDMLHDKWYSMHRIAGHMVAILEAID